MAKRFAGQNQVQLLRFKECNNHHLANKYKETQWTKAVWLQEKDLNQDPLHLEKSQTREEEPLNYRMLSANRGLVQTASTTWRIQESFLILGSVKMRVHRKISTSQLVFHKVLMWGNTQVTVKINKGHHQDSRRISHHHQMTYTTNTKRMAVAQWEWAHVGEIQLIEFLLRRLNDQSVKNLKLTDKILQEVPFVDLNQYID